MAESVEDTNDSYESRGLGPFKRLPIQNINELPIEILSKVLVHLPREDLVLNRSVCRHWRSVIDEHCPLGFVNLMDDEFLERKMQLRMRTCSFWSVNDDRRILLSHPHCIRKITIRRSDSVGNIRRLLNQVKPYINCLEIYDPNLKENIFTLPHEFPQLRELRVGKHSTINSSASVTLNNLFCHHRVPLLEKLVLTFSVKQWQLMDETYTYIFNFLANQVETMKHLVVQFIYDGEEPGEGIEFDLEDGVKRLLYNGKLQLYHLEITFPRKYTTAWAPILQNQKNVTHLFINGDYSMKNFGEGVPFFVIHPGISSSISTLRTIHLEHLSSIDSNGRFIPFDCSVFRNAVNLTELKLSRYTKEADLCDEPDDMVQGAEMINIGEISLGSLKLLKIIDFLCNAVELQDIVDRAQVLEGLHLIRTRAPADSPNFDATGVYPRTIQSFMEKLNKEYIYVSDLNHANQEIIDDYMAFQVLYPTATIRLNEFAWDLRLRT